MPVATGANAPPQVPARDASRSPKRPAEDTTAEVEMGEKRPSKVRGTAGAGVATATGKFLAPPATEEGWQVVWSKKKTEHASLRGRSRRGGVQLRPLGIVNPVRGMTSLTTRKRTAPDVQ